MVALGLDGHVDRMDSMSNVMDMIFDVIDAVAQVRLSPKAAATTAKVRQAMQEAQQRIDHEKRQEVGMAAGNDA